MSRNNDGDGYAPAWVQSVTLAAIADQRAKGWPDFHPEEFCHQCGRRCPVWHADSEAWFAAYPEARGTDGGGICCPTCFAADYAKATGQDRIIWSLSIHPHSADRARPAPAAPEPEQRWWCEEPGWMGACSPQSAHHPDSFGCGWRPPAPVPTAVEPDIERLDVSNLPIDCVNDPAFVEAVMLDTPPAVEPSTEDGQR